MRMHGDKIMKKRKIFFYVLATFLVFVLLSGVALGAYYAKYNTNTGDSTFTVKGSLQGEKTGTYYTWAYSTIRWDAHVENPTYSQLWCSIELNGVDRYGRVERIDDGEAHRIVLRKNQYAPTDQYDLPANTYHTLISSFEVVCLGGEDHAPNNPTRVLTLD